MKVKVFQPNHHGKIEFTRAELEKLLNEVYSDGYTEGEFNARSRTWTWTSPYIYNNDLGITGTLSSTDAPPLTINTSTTQPIDKLTCAYDSATDKNDASITKVSMVNDDPISITLGNIDREAIKEYVSGTITALHRAQAAPGDVFTNLAKELNF